MVKEGVTVRATVSPEMVFTKICIVSSLSDEADLVEENEEERMLMVRLGGLWLRLGG